MAVKSFLVTTASGAGLLFGLGCGGQMGSDSTEAGGTGSGGDSGSGGVSGCANGSDTSSGPTNTPLESIGPVVDIASVPRFSGVHAAWAEQASRLALVYAVWGTEGGVELALLDAGGAKISESRIATLALAIASDGTRFGLLTSDGQGYRFLLFEADGKLIGSPTELGLNPENGLAPLGATLWTGNDWLVLLTRATLRPIDPDLYTRELWFARLAANGALVNGPKLLGSGIDSEVRIARTPSGATLIAWYSPHDSGVGWAQLLPDGTLGQGQGSGIHLFPLGSLALAANDQGFTVGWRREQSECGQIVRLSEDGTVLCGPREVPLTAVALAANATTTIGVGTRVIDANASTSTVEAFTVLDDCSLSRSVTLETITSARRYFSDELSLTSTGRSMLATWVDYSRAPTIQARAIGPSSTAAAR